MLAKAHPARVSPDTRSLPTPLVPLSREAAAKVARALVLIAAFVGLGVFVGLIASIGMDRADAAAKACGGQSVGLAYVECAR